MFGSKTSTDTSYFIKPGPRLCECHVCGAYTDSIKWAWVKSYVRNGFQGAGTVTENREYPLDESVCPNEKENWHEEIDDKIRLLLEKPHPKFYRDALIKEILALRRKHRKKRKDEISGGINRKISLTEPWFSKDDVDPDLWKRIWNKVSPLLRRKKTERKKS
jgi:hypothetical protein